VSHDTIEENLAGETGFCVSNDTIEENLAGETT